MGQPVVPSVQVSVSFRCEAEDLARLPKPQRDAVLLGISKVLGAQIDLAEDRPAGTGETP